MEAYCAQHSARHEHALRCVKNSLSGPVPTTCLTAFDVPRSSRRRLCRATFSTVVLQPSSIRGLATPWTCTFSIYLWPLPFRLTLLRGKSCPRFLILLFIEVFLSGDVPVEVFVSTTSLSGAVDLVLRSLATDTTSIPRFHFTLIRSALCDDSTELTRSLNRRNPCVLFSESVAD